MASFRFEICNDSTVEQLIGFIDEHWKQDHIFVRSRQLFDWQHKLALGEYSFVLAFDKTNNKICGVLGFILTSQYSNSLRDEREAWLAIWQVSEALKSPGLGVGMLNFLKTTYQLKTICAFGLSEGVVPLYKALKYEVSVLNHHVLVNPKIETFSILEAGEWQPSKKKILDTGYSLKNLNPTSIKKICDKHASGIFVTRPLKDANYIINRYVNHPIYEYDIYSVVKNNEAVAILVTRNIIIKGATIVRIIDYQGEFVHFSFLNNSFLAVLDKYGAEYIDFMQFGIPIEVLEKAEFVDIYSIKEMVVPDYFSPFLKKNIIIDFAFKTEMENMEFFICKGDSDQDRPS